MSDTERVTARFESYGDENDASAMTVAPFAIDRIVDSLDSLYAIDTSSVASDGHLLAFVRNSENSAAGKDLRGDYYIFSGDRRKWIPIVLGNHTHDNKELLDQLGNIDVSNFGSAKKFLSIAIGNDPSQTYNYKLAWQDLPQGLPDLPAKDSVSGNLYLTYRADGTYGWDNKLIPFQTFQIRDIEIVPNDADHASLKDENGDYAFAYPGNSITFSGIQYDADAGDRILLFDGRYFLTDFSVSKYLVDLDTTDGKKEIRELTITASDPDNDGVGTFSVGERITAIILKEGAKGVLDSIESEYLTREDAIRIITNGTLTLKNYYTKTESDKRFAQYQHEHSQFSKIGHNHDERYAPYYHTHPEYVLEGELTDKIAAYLAKDPAILANLSQLSATLNSQTASDAIANLISNYYTKTEADAKLADLSAKISDSLTKSLGVRIDAVAADVSKNAESISNLSATLTNYINSPKVSGSQIGVGKAITVIGEGSDTFLNGYKSGTIIGSETPISEVLTKIFTSRNREALIQPKIEVSTTPSDLDSLPIGIITTISIKVKYDRGSAGAPAALRIRYVDVNGNERLDDDFDMSLSEWEDGGITYYGSRDPLGISIELDYQSGETKIDTIGDSYGISSGTLKKSISLQCYNPMFVGAIDGTSYGDSDITALKSVFDTPSDGIIRASIPAGSMGLLIALPISAMVNGNQINIQEFSLDSIAYDQQSVDVTDLFSAELRAISLADAAPAYYRVYSYFLDSALSEDIDFTIRMK